MTQEVRNTANDALNIIKLKKMRNLSLLMTVVASIDAFFFYINYDDKPLLFMGACAHLIMLLLMAHIWNCLTYKRIAFFLCIICNYMLIIPKLFLYPHEISWELFDGIILLIPQYVIFCVFHDIKQMTILCINSIMVIGLYKRGDLLFNWGLNDPETIGVNSFITFLISIIALINYIILLQIRYHKLSD